MVAVREKNFSKIKILPVSYLGKSIFWVDSAI